MFSVVKHNTFVFNVVMHAVNPRTEPVVALYIRDKKVDRGWDAG
jgi:hypothetical protein